MYSDFKIDLDAYLAANWTLTPIFDYANNPGDPGGYDPWMGYRPIILSDEVQSIASGPHCILGSYGIEFTVAIGSAEGQQESIDLTEALKALFIGKRIPTSDTATIDTITVDTEFGVKQEDESSGKWYKATVFVAFEYRYFI